MLTIDKNYNIELTRGDILPLYIKAVNKDGTDYEFKTNDVVRFKITEKNKCNRVIVQKDVKVTEPTILVKLDLTKNDTKIGKLINKPADYWYEVELNPDTNPQTILGYTKENGGKLFTLLPEGGDKK